uniref:LamG domain-containing protein n=1 Tax=Hydrogenimonas sp. TaxID=2231112 RepID=UPI00262EB97B
NKRKHIYLYDRNGTLLEHVQKSYTIDLVESDNDVFIGGVKYSRGNKKYSFDGWLDKVMVFRKVLQQGDIEDILRNQLHGKYYDSLPMAVCPICPVADYRMDVCGFSGYQGEVEDSSGYEHNGTALNGVSTASGALCMSAALDGVDDMIKVPDSDKLDGTRQLTITLWMNPVELRQTNGSNARGVISKRRSAGSNESYGIFFWNGHQMADDDGDGEYDRARLYIDIDGNNDRFATQAFIQRGKWTHLAVVYDGFSPPNERVKVYIDGRFDKAAREGSDILANYASDLYIGDLHYPNQNKVFKGLLDEVKIVDYALTHEEILRIYENERTHHSYDGTYRNCPDCSNPVVEQYRFDAWDTGRSIDDRNISTKLVNEPFSLQVASLNETNDGLENFDGTICIRLKDDRDTPLTPWNTLHWQDRNSTDLLFTIDHAVGGARSVLADLHWKQDVNESCPLQQEENASTSSDAFSVRPLKIVFVQPGEDANLTSEHPYQFPNGIEALDTHGNVAREYNTTLSLIYRLKMKNGETNTSLAGTLNQSLSSFADGIADYNLSFDDVAIVSLELNDTQWTAIDADDTPESNRTIYGVLDVRFIPHHFNVTFSSTPVMEDNDTANGFTYLSNDLTMSAWLRGLNIDVSARGENDGVMMNFSNPMDRLFADPVDIAPLLQLPDRHSAPNIMGEPQPQTGVDLGFVSGNAVLTYSDVAFNYARLYDSPIDPFAVLGSEGNITVAVQDSIFPGVVGNLLSNFSGGALFYYGRLRAEDIRTTEPSVENIVDFEVFDRYTPAYVAGFRQNSLYWYRNEKHRSRMNGHIIEANATADVQLGSAADANMVMQYERFGSGTLTMEINTTENVAKTRVIHLNIDPWLWYVPKGFGGDYAYTPGSDCMVHPCFNYRFDRPGGGRRVQSGDFNGSDFDAGSLDTNVTYRRKHGVKVFR